MTKIPKVKFIAMSFNENMDMIAMFIYIEKNKDNKPNTDYFKNIFSEIQDFDFNNLNIDQIKKILISNLLDKWNNEMKHSKEIVDNFQTKWDLINDNVMLDLSNRLNIKWKDEDTNIVARVGVMYSCPRYISKRTFGTNINANESTMKETAIHEICHFLYFEKWKELYNDYDENHYNHPHIIWHLSEAIIDPLLNNDTFRKYTNIEIKSYDIFYSTFINGISIIDNLRNIVSSKPIEESIRESYKLFLDNEQLFRGTN